MAGRLSGGKPRIVIVRRCASPSFGSSPPNSGVSASTASRYIGTSGTAIGCRRGEIVPWR